MPPPAGADDYDGAGRLRLGQEYRDWLGGPDNWLAGRAVAATAAVSPPRIAFPPPGTTFTLTPTCPARAAV